MFKFHEDRITVLGICVGAPTMAGLSARLDFRAVASARRSIDMLRMLSFDLLLVGLTLPDMSTWEFLRHLKTMWPQQKWALVGGPISEQQEVTARMFGATTLFEITPASNELLMLTARLRQRAIASVISGKFDGGSINALQHRRSRVS